MNTISEPINEHERLVEILKKARGRHPAPSADARERNLRRLVRAAMPEAEAPETLRERVQALAVTAESLRSRAAREGSPGRRRRPHWPSPAVRWVAAVALPVAVAAVLLLLNLTESPVQALGRTLSAMARVKSAHYTGWFIWYESRDHHTGQPVPGRMKEEWWYKAPGKYWRYRGPAVPGWGIMSDTLIVNGGHAAFILHSIHPPAIVLESAASLMEDLTPLDFFSPQGMIGRARNEKNAKISSEKATYLGQKVRIIRLIYERAPDKYLWLLWIDPHSDLILRAEQTGYLRISRWGLKQKVIFDHFERKSGWGLKQKVIFDHFDYNVPVHDSLFQLPARHSPSGKDGLVRSSAKRGVGATARAHRKPGR